MSARDAVSRRGHIMSLHRFKVQLLILYFNVNKMMTLTEDSLGCMIL